MDPSQPRTDSFLTDLLADRLADPYARYVAMRRSGAVLRDASGIVLVTRYSEVAQIIASPRFAFIGPQAFPTVEPAARARLAAVGFFELLMFRNGSAHRHSRQLLSTIFSFESIERLRAAVLAQALRLSHDTPAGDGARLRQLAVSLPIETLMQLLGFARGEILDLLSRSRRVSALLAAAPLDTESLSAGIEEFATSVEWLDRRLTDDPSHPLSDVLRRSTPADRRQFLADLLVFLLTGHDTSVAMLSNAVAALGSFADVREKLAADGGLIARAVDELLRYDTPGQIVFRHALEDTSIGEHPVCRRDMLALLIGSANRDESVFEQPDQLNLCRDKRHSISFGAGPHTCLGVAIARLQLAAFLSALAPTLARLGDDALPLKPRQHGLTRYHEWPVPREASTRHEAGTRRAT